MRDSGLAIQSSIFNFGISKNSCSMWNTRKESLLYYKYAWFSGIMAKFPRKSYDLLKFLGMSLNVLSTVI